CFYFFKTLNHKIILRAAGGTFPLALQNCGTCQEGVSELAALAGLAVLAALAGTKKPPRFKRDGYPIKSSCCRGKPFANCSDLGPTHENGKFRYRNAQII